MTEKCANCGHEIVKRNGIWKHSFGGTYCKVGILGGCLCSSPTPKKKGDE